MRLYGDWWSAILMRRMIVYKPQGYYNAIDWMLVIILYDILLSAVARYKLFHFLKCAGILAPLLMYVYNYFLLVV